MILAEVSISLPLSVVGLLLILLSVLSLVSKDSSFTPAGQSKRFHFGLWDILLVAGLFMVIYPLLWKLFPHDGDVMRRNRYGQPYRALYFLALLFTFSCHMGIMILLKKVRQKWAMDDLKERRKKSGYKANRRSGQKTRQRAK